MNAKERHEEAMFIREPATPRSEMRRNAWGSLLMSAQTVPGLCTRGRKCVRHDDHDGPCWPT